MTGERAGVDGPSNAAETSPAEHARVVPAVVAAMLRGSLNLHGRRVAPRELVAWARFADLTESDRDALAMDVVLRLRRFGRQMSDRPSGLSLPSDWTSRLTGFEVRKVQTFLTTVRPDQPLAQVTIDEFSKGIGMKLAPSLRVLAKLEAGYWHQTGQPHSVLEWAGSAEHVENPVEDAVDASEVLGDLGFVMTLPWLKDVRSNDIRFCGAGELPIEAYLADMRDSGNWTRGGLLLVRQLARCARLTFAEEVEDLARSAVGRLARSREREARWIAMFTRRYVSPLGPGRTLSEVGTEFGITRERVRQVCDKLQGVLKDHTVCAPATSRVLAAARRIAPQGAAEMNAQLSNMLGEGAGFESAQFFASDIGLKDAPMFVEEVFVSLGGAKIFSGTINLPSQASLVKATLRCAARQTALMGCTNLLRVAGALALTEGFAPGKEALESILGGATGFRWLDQDAAWFTLGDCGDSSAVASRLRKMVAAAAGSLTIESIVEGLVSDDLWLYRERDRDTGVPPMHVLTQMLRGWSWLRCLQKNRFELRAPFETDVLSPAERILIDVITKHGGAATRLELANSVIGDMGITDFRFQQVLGTSPIVLRLEFGIYGLRGHLLADDALSKARRRTVQQRIDQLGAPLLDFPGFVVTVTEGSLKNEQYTVPQSWRDRLLPGTYRVLCIDAERPLEELIRTTRVRQSGVMVSINRYFPNARPGDWYAIHVAAERELRITLHRAASSAVAAAISDRGCLAGPHAKAASDPKPPGGPLGQDGAAI